MPVICHIKNSLRTLLFCLIVLMAIADHVEAIKPDHIKIVEVIGTGVIAGDETVARDRAISESLVSAVALVAADFLPVEFLVQNFQILNENLYAQTGTFIQEYKVLAEITYGKLYRVMVQAAVSIDKVRHQLSDIGFVLGSKTMPSLLFLIVEGKSDDSLQQYWWMGEGLHSINRSTENAMAAVMKRSGFILIDNRTILADEEGNHKSILNKFDDQAAIRLGIQLQADVVIIGNVIAEQAPNTMGEDIKTFKGTITARALRTDTGEEIAATFQTAVTANKDEIEGVRKALENTGTLAGEALSLKIAAIWQKNDKEFKNVKIIVEGKDHLAHFIILRRTINKLASVREVKTIEIKSDSATIIVEYEGNAKSLADALMLNTFDSFGINISEVAQEHLRISIIPSRDL